MEQETKSGSITAGIEPKAVNLPEATPRVEDPRELAEHSENALFPADSSELNAVMELVKQEIIIEQIEKIVTDEIDFDNLEAAAAGASGGGGGDGSDFVRLARIIEEVGPLSYEYEISEGDIQDEIEGIALSASGDRQDNEQQETPQDPPSDPDEDPRGEDPEVPEDEDEEDPPSDPEDEDEPDDTPVDWPEIPDKPGNNGWGNGDQDAPGNSGPNNNAENNTSGKEDPRGGNNVVPGGNGGGDSTGGGDSPDPTEDVRLGSNPGNDKPVGNSPWDGETGASGKPGQGNHQDGIDTDPNQPGGKDRGQNLIYDDLLEENPSNGFNGTSGADLMLLQLNMDIDKPNSLM